MVVAVGYLCHVPAAQKEKKMEEDICPDCGQPGMLVSWKSVQFPVGKEKVQLVAKLLTWSCPSCGRQFLDAEAAEIQEEVVRKWREKTRLQRDRRKGA